MLSCATAFGQDCSITNLPNQFTVKLAWQSAQDGPSTVCAPVVANLNPQQDSLPEIIVVEGQSVVQNRIQIYKGDGSNAANPFILIVPGGMDPYPSLTPTIGDVDADGIPELLVACADRRIRVFKDFMENPAAPMTLWITTGIVLDFAEQRPLLADFNGDGIAEVYAGNDIYTFNLSNPASPTLNKMLNGNATMGQSAFSAFSEGSCNPTAVDILSVADCNGDPDCAGLELVAGPVIYSIDLDPADGDPMEIKIQRDMRNMVPATMGYRDGYTAVADVDLDGIMDIVVTSIRQTNQTGVYIWNKNGFIRWLPYPANTFSSGSLACIANVYDDRQHGFTADYPEILICSSMNFTCYNLQAAQLTPATPYWWNLPTSDGSGWTGSTVYDFNGDGISEIVYRDESNLRILYGGAAPFPPGVDALRNWLTTPCFSVTSDEYAVVADVDNDGETEIAVCGRIALPPPLQFNERYRGRLRIYESDGFPWVPSRNVWNQFNYFIVNVNDDLSIPANQLQHHLELPAPGSGIRPFNSYLSQRPVLNENFLPEIPLPDVVATVVEVVCQADSMVLALNICNQGNKVFPAGAPIAFYLANPTVSTTTLIGNVQLTNLPVEKDSCATFQFTIPRVSTGTQFGVVNDDASVVAPFQLDMDFPSSDILECDFLNNLFQFEVPIPQAPVDLGPDVQVCQDTTLELNAGSGFVQYLWQDGSTSSAFQADQSGVYWVEATDLCAIRHQDTVLLESIGRPMLQLDTLHGDCQGNPAQLHASAQGNYPPFQFEWSTGETGADISTQTDGMYTVKVTNAKGCVSIDSVRAEAGGLVEITAQVNAGILCFGQTGSIALNIQTGQPPYQYAWSDGSQGTQLNNVPAGTYTVVVTDASQCSDVATVILQQPDALISSGFSTVPACEDAPTGAITFLGAAQGTPPYQLLWSNNATTDQIAQLPAGQYQLTITDANGCSLTQTIDVPGFAVPAEGTVVQDVSCFGANDGAINFLLSGGTPGYSYLWSNNSTEDQILALAPGSYALTFTYANGACSQTRTFQIFEPLPLVTSTQQAAAGCHGGSGGFVDLSVQNGIAPLTYFWSNGAVTEDLNNIAEGQYTVTVTDATGCTATTSTLLMEPPPLQSNGVNTTPSCPGLATGNAIFQGASQGTPPYSLLWSNNIGTPVNPNLPAGSYQLTITDANGCTLLETLTVTEHNEPGLQAALQQVDCFGAQNGSIDLQLSGGTPGFDYFWSNNSTTQDLSQLGPGNYTLTITYAGGACSSTASYQISEPAALVFANTVLTQLNCYESGNGAVDISISGGTGAYSFLWSNSATTEDISGLPAGPYAVTITDANGCTLEEAFSLSQPPALVLSTLLAADTCETGSGAIVLSVAGGTQPYQYNWSNNASGPGTNNLSPGVYSVTVTDDHACTQTLVATVAAYGLIPELESYSGVITCAQPRVSIGVTANQNDLHYNWQSPGGPLPDAADHVVSNAGAYLVTATNSFGCTAQTQLLVAENTIPPLAEAGPPAMLVPCSETMVLLHPEGSSQGPGFENRWTVLENGQVVHDTIAWLLPVTEGGWFVHTVTNLQNGCRAQDSIRLDWDDPIQAVYHIEPILCYGDDDGVIRFEQVEGGSAPYVYAIDNQNFTTSATFHSLEPGAYSLRVRDGFGCTWEAEVVLTEPPLMSVALAASDTSLELGQSVQLIATVSPGNASLSRITWEPDDVFAFDSAALRQRVTPETGTEFQVQVVDQNGCIAEDRIWVTVNNFRIYVPNVIMPESESNGWFTIFAGEDVSEIEVLRVFDRWGEMVFERQAFLPNAPDLGWDGSFRGEPVNPGVFVWYAKVLLPDGRSLALKGDVTVLR
ncbi:MAG: gliding motility-associated C-terminal domain-containing protein [Saprospiraceae bacterium]|nr:gliding motility-associated C-terminal domain-containing protein [Saprospiraceae bacterium]